MTPSQLRTLIAPLPEHLPHTRKPETALGGYSLNYSSQREHWLRWLNEYDGPGAFGRTRFDHDAAFAYNHCGCPAMALWLGEASGVSKRLVTTAARSALQRPGRFSAKCGAIRRVIPWSLIEPRLLRK